MSEITEPSPEEIKRTKRVYWAATFGFLVLIMALYALLMWTQSGGSFLPEGPFKAFVKRMNPSGVFFGLATFSAIAVCRRMGVSLEARWRERITIRRRSRSTTTAEPTEIRRDRSICFAGIFVGLLIGTLSGALYIFRPEQADTMTAVITTGSGLLTLWSFLLWQFGDWRIARVDQDGITINTRAPWLPGSMPRHPISWQNIGGVEIRHQRTVTGQAMVPHAYVWDDNTDRWWKIPLTMAVTAQKEPFLQRLRQEGNEGALSVATEPIDTIALPIEKRYASPEVPVATVHLGKP